MGFLSTLSHSITCLALMFCECPFDKKVGTTFGENKNGSNPELDWIQAVFEKCPIFALIGPSISVNGNEEMMKMEEGLGRSPPQKGEFAGKDDFC